MQSFATATAPSKQTVSATPAANAHCSSDSSAARAASHAAAVIDSTVSSISAHRCLMAWNEPIGFPNCSRTFA